MNDSQGLHENDEVRPIPVPASFKWIMWGTAAVLAAGFIFLVIGFVGAVSNRDAGAVSLKSAGVVEGPEGLALPADWVIESMALDYPMIALHVRKPDGETLMVFDLTRQRLVKEVPLNRE